MPTNNGLELFISKNDSNFAGNEQHGPINDQVSKYIKQHLIQKIVRIKIKEKQRLMIQRIMRFNILTGK